MMPRDDPASAPVDAQWYKDAVIYQLHVRSFHDNDADGIGDFRGLIQKLDYLQELGVTAIWILPFYPSPLKDDGYDIADYTSVNSAYGNLRDFQAFLREAHKRGLRVITELVLNHTSDQHPWFQRSRRSAQGSRARNYYVWSDTPDRYAGTRIIFQDFESSNWAWDPVARAYYWHRFYSHQPDLNFDNPEVHRAMFQAVDFWLRMGVDGLRLDAVPYLYERDGTSCENLPETHAFLKDLRRHVDASFPNRMILGEANQWPDDAIAYFGDGDECHAAFHFPLMPRLFMAVHMEDRFPIVDILKQTPAIPENCQWAVFLRNHDELTLEMVTDEDRAYMYRVYAQDSQARINLGIRRRLAPLLGNNRRRLELMNGLLMSLPGSPVIYYGDEIGMGDNIYVGDRNGVRTPMQWSGDRNAGFSRANPQRLYLPVIIEPEYHYGTVNVEAQHNNPHSLLWWMKRLIALRKRYKAFGRGSLELLHPENRKVLAFIRKYQDETILVIANMSRFVQYAELDLAPYAGARPIELFGRTEFPPITEAPFFITLGPHAFYWFALHHEPSAVPVSGEMSRAAAIPKLSIAGTAGDVFRAAALESILPAYLKSQRWFGGKARVIQIANTQEVIALPSPDQNVDARVLLIQAVYLDGEPETYLLPLAVATEGAADQLRAENADSIIADIQLAGSTKRAVLFDPLLAMETSNLGSVLLDAIARKRRFKGTSGDIVALATEALSSVKVADLGLSSFPLNADQTNSSIVYGETFILKLFRRVHEGKNPDLEIGRFLTERGRGASSPPVAGYLEYRSALDGQMTLGLLQTFIPNQGDAWSHALDHLAQYFDAVKDRARPADLDDGTAASWSMMSVGDKEPPSAVADLIGGYLESATLLGRRIGELHLALASGLDDREFQPEPFMPFDQRSIYQSMRALVAQVFPLLRSRLRSLHDATHEDARQVLEREPIVLRRFQTLVNQPIGGMRIRCHGDLHLGQILFTGSDFVITDFEGEPSRSLSERRLKRPPLRDVAGMIRSWDYAESVALRAQIDSGAVDLDKLSEMRKWARLWHNWVSAAFLKSYTQVVQPVLILPRTTEDVQILLDALILEKTVYELGYELNNRPSWVDIPVRGILYQTESTH